MFKITLKDARIICLCIGAVYILIGFLSLLILPVEHFLLARIRDQEGMHIIRHLEMILEVSLLYLPQMMLIGALYLILGFKFDAMRNRSKFIFNLVLGSLTFVLALAYCIHISTYMRAFIGEIPEIPSSFESFINSLYMTGSILTACAVLVIPTFLIGKAIKDDVK